MLSRLWAVKEGERVLVVTVGECYYVGTSAVPGSGVLMLIAARCSRANIHSGEQGECGGDNDGDWHWRYGRFEFRCQRVWDCMKLNGTSSRGKCGELDATGGWGSYITSRSLVMDERGHKLWPCSLRSQGLPCLRDGPAWLIPRLRSHENL